MKHRTLSREQALKQLRDHSGAMMLLIGHDETCPGAHGRPDRCNCTPSHELVSVKDLLLEVERISRKVGQRKPGH